VTQCTHTKYKGCPSCPCKVTITISRDLADELANDWFPLDENDPMIELFEVCKKALNNPYQEFYEAWLELDQISERIGPSKEEWDVVQNRFSNALSALEVNNDNC
jgi:hypothetical protein